MRRNETRSAPNKTPLRSRFFQLLFCVFFALGILVTGTNDAVSRSEDQPVAAPPAIVAVASSLRTAWPQWIRHFEQLSNAKPSGLRVKTSYGSSGNLTRQILQGAAFELLLTANREYAERLESLTMEPTVTLGFGKLAWVAGPGSQAESVLRESSKFGLQALLGLITADKSFKLAIANPRHAPYGVAAREVLSSIIEELPDAAAIRESGFLRRILLNGENAAQALQFVVKGGADLALIPLSLLLESNSALSHLTYIEVDQKRYAPVEHQLVLLRGAGTTAQQLFAYLQHEQASKQFLRFGLTK